MQCPRCGRSLLALARRPASWVDAGERNLWIGLHPGDTAGTSSCRLRHTEAMALSAGIQPVAEPAPLRTKIAA